jgi:hypothetical protein
VNFANEPALTTLVDLDLAVVAHVIAQFVDQAIDLGVVLGALVRRQTQNVAVVVAKLGIAQRHQASLSVSERRPGTRPSAGAVPPWPRSLHTAEMSGFRQPNMVLKAHFKDYSLRQLRYMLVCTLGGYGAAA